MVMAWRDVCMGACFGEIGSVHITRIFLKNRKGINVTLELIIIKVIPIVITILSGTYPIKLRLVSKRIYLNSIDRLQADGIQHK